MLSLKVLHCIFPVRTVKGLQGSRLLSRRLLSTQVTSLMFSKQDTPFRPPGLLVLLFLLSCPPATLLSLPSYFPSKLNLGVASPRGHPVRASSPLPGSPRAASARLARTRLPVSPARPCVSISVAPRYLAWTQVCACQPGERRGLSLCVPCPAAQHASGDRGGALAPCGTVCRSIQVT